ncbi:MAG: serine hydrolase domain-containing protein [Putridiphycobacter sp.]
MKTHIFFSLLFISILGTISFGQQQNLTRKQHKLILQKTKDFPVDAELSIAIIQDGQVFLKGLKRTNKGLIDTDNTRNNFEIGSITKVFTSCLLANLVIENKIRLNDNIQSYFDFTLKNNNITVLQLANHTSGLPRLPSNLNLLKADPLNPYKKYGEAELIEYLQYKMPSNDTSSLEFNYSNLGAGILGYLLTQKTGKTYETLLQDYITSKFEMSQTTTQINSIQNNLINGLDASGLPTTNWNMNILVGAGGIFSTAQDLSKFILAQFNPENKALQLMQKTTFTIPESKMAIGLGLQILKKSKKKTWYLHNGGTGGYSSFMVFDLQHKNGVIVLSNLSAFSQASRNIDSIGLKLMDTL